MKRIADLVDGGDDLEEALRLLETIRHPTTRGAARRYRAKLLLFHLDRPSEALGLANELLAEEPDSEANSLFRFHALVRLGRSEEAFDEMNRFLAKHESWEYRRLRKEMKDGECPPPPLDWTLSETED